MWGGGGGEECAQERNGYGRGGGGGGGKRKWVQEKDMNRLECVREGETWEEGGNRGNIDMPGWN